MLFAIFDTHCAFVEPVDYCDFLLPPHQIRLGLMNIELEHVSLQLDLIRLKLFFLSLLASSQLKLLLHHVNLFELLCSVDSLHSDLLVLSLLMLLLISINHVPEIVAAIRVHLVSGLLVNLGDMVPHCLL